MSVLNQSYETLSRYSNLEEAMKAYLDINVPDPRIDAEVERLRKTGDFDSVEIIEGEFPIRATVQGDSRSDINYIAQKHVFGFHWRIDYVLDPAEGG